MDEYTAVVTGAGGAIGGVVVEEFADAGSPVVAGVHREVEGRFAERPGVESVVVDARDEYDLELLMERAAHVGGDIDLVVPCAAVFHGEPGEHWLAGEGYDAFDDEFRTNARGVFAAVKEALPHLAPDARVLVPSGGVAHGSHAGYGGYGVSKAAAEAVARGFAAELEQAVGVVDPGPVASDLTGEDGREPEEVAELFRWAATGVDADELNGERLGLAEWKRATQ